MGKATEWAANYSFGLTGPFDDAVSVIDAKREEDGKAALSKKITEQAAKFAELSKAVTDAERDEAKEKAAQANLEKAAAQFAKLFILADNDGKELTGNQPDFVQAVKVATGNLKAVLTEAQEAVTKAQEAFNEAKNAHEAIKDEGDDKQNAKGKMDDAAEELKAAKAKATELQGKVEDKKAFEAEVKEAQVNLLRFFSQNNASDDHFALLQTKQFGGKAKFFFAKTLQGTIYVVAFPLALLGQTVKFVSDKSGLVLNKITGGRICANNDGSDGVNYVSAAAAFRRAFVDGRGWGFGNTFNGKGGKNVENLFANKDDDAFMLIVKGAGRAVAKAFLIAGNAVFIIPASNVASAFTNVKGYFSKAKAEEDGSESSSENDGKNATSHGAEHDGDGQHGHRQATSGGADPVAPNLENQEEPSAIRAAASVNSRDELDTKVGGNVKPATALALAATAAAAAAPAPAPAPVSQKHGGDLDAELVAPQDDEETAAPAPEPEDSGDQHTSNP